MTEQVAEPVAETTPEAEATEQVAELHLLMNNNFGDYAVRNAYRLARLLGLDYPDPFAGDET